MKDLELKNRLMFDMVEIENQRQLSIWGVQSHEPNDWLNFAMEELGETAEAISDWKFRDGSAGSVVKEAIQTATLMLKIAEMFYAVRREEQP